MGSKIEINDTLKISRERGFPRGLVLEDHLHDPKKAARFVGQEFDFWNKDERLYHTPPTRGFLVEEMPDGRWLHWGHALVVQQTIKPGRTEGRYRIIKIYQPEYQMQATVEESPEGKSYFPDKPTSFRQG